MNKYAHEKPIKSTMGYGVDKNNKKLNKLTDYLFLKKYFCNLYWIIVHVTAVLQVSST